MDEQERLVSEINSGTRVRIANTTTRKVDLVARQMYDGKVPKERRGGDRVSIKSIDKKQKIRQFISKLKATESRYNKQKSKRIYLSPELSIAKLHKAFNKQCDAASISGLTMFSKIFNN